MTVASARLAPTERSMPRVRMTSCWPIATMAITAVCARMLPILTGLEEIRGQQADRRGQQMRISSGPMLSSRRPSETADPPPARSRCGETLSRSLTIAHRFPHDRVAV